MIKVWHLFVRELRLAAGEELIALALRLLPTGPEKVELARFIAACWIGRLAAERIQK